MLTYHQLLAFFRQQEAGQGLVEYAMILMLVAIVVLAVLALFGPTIAAEYAVALESVHCAGHVMELNLGTDQIAVRGTSMGGSSVDCQAVDQETFKQHIRDRLTP